MTTLFEFIKKKSRGSVIVGMTHQVEMCSYECEHLSLVYQSDTL